MAATPVVQEPPNRKQSGIGASIHCMHRVGVARKCGSSCLRTIQGIGVGGEWGGSVLLAMEWNVSLTLLPGCMNSALAKIRPGPAWTRSNAIRGVRPIRSSADDVTPAMGG
jgi:hypothetical protein